MSRVGKLPIPVPEKVKIGLEGQTVSVEGPKGSLRQTFHHDVKFEQKDGEILVSPANGTRFANAMYGTARSIVGNMVDGVLTGFSKDLEINGVGFQAILQGKILKLKLGYSHDIDWKIPEGVNVTIDGGGTKVKVEGIDKQAVGQAAASIKSFYPVEPYKGKGVRIVGDHVIRKEGKTVA